MKFSRVCAVTAAAALLSLPATVAGAVEAPQSTENPQSVAAVDAGRSAPKAVTTQLGATDSKQSENTSEEKSSGDNSQPEENFSGLTHHDFHYKFQKEYVVVGGENAIELYLKADKSTKEAYTLKYHYEVPQGYGGTLSGQLECVQILSTPGACERFDVVQKNEGLNFFTAQWKPEPGDEVVLRGKARITDTIPPKEGLNVALTAVLSQSDQLVAAPMRLEVKLFANDEAANAAQNMKSKTPTHEPPKVKEPQATDQKGKTTTDKAKNPKAAKLANTGWETGILLSVAMLGAATGSALLLRREP